nr:MAG TPA: hypothetical protein [Bacteriophage sp.]
MIQYNESVVSGLLTESLILPISVSNEVNI